MLKLNNVSTGYGSLKILNGISLNVHKGEIVCVLGGNGAGKTTMLKAIMGILPVWNDGEIIFNGKLISNFKTYDITYLGIAYIPEGKSVFPKMTVLENLQLAVNSSKTKANDGNEMITHIMAKFPVLRKRLKQDADTLSGGEQRMLTIAQGLLTKPEIMLIDEPSLGLAPKIVHDTFEIIKTIQQEGVTILLVEQHVYLALKIANRGYVIENGNIAIEGSGKELLSSPYIKKAYLGL